MLDAQTGQNGIAQARAFTEAVEVTGVVLTKTGRLRQGRRRPRGARGARACRSASSGSARAPTTSARSRRGVRRRLLCGLSRMEGARILIVEDHPTMREAMRLVLEGEGFEIDEAADGPGRPRDGAGTTPPTWSSST